MDNKPSVIINKTSFPNQRASDLEKMTPEYGLNIAKAIEGEWFYKGTNHSCRYYDRYNEFHQLRLYARGEQSVSIYKSQIAVNGDLSHTNLDWSIVPIIPKFVDIVVNGMNDRMYKIKAESQDIMSAEKKNLFQDMVEADMAAKDFLQQTMDEFGIDAFNVDPEEIPENDEELSLYMQMKYKPGIEIAEEVALNNLLLLNDYQDSIKPMVDYDITVIGIGAVKHNFNVNSGVEVEYVDPSRVIHSYTEKRDFSDCYYFGEIKEVHYTELLKINPNLTKDQLIEAMAAGNSWNDYFTNSRKYTNNILDGETVSLLFFNYKTDKRYVFKKKYLDNGGERVIKKDDSFNPPQDDRFERIESVKEVWYDGVLVLGTNMLIKWELAKNMVRPDSPSQKALPNYVMVAPRMYRGVIESLVRRMKPFADQIQLTHLKLQQVVQKTAPPGVFIDADGLAEIDLGNGATYTPNDALSLYFQTGSIIGRSYTGDGEFNNARVPIQELSANSGGGQISALINVYNYNLNMIRDVTGLNEARDGSKMDPDSTIGLQKLAALNSNTATKHILDAGLLITKRLCKGLSLRVADILEHADFSEEFAMQIGSYNMAILEDIKSLYLHSFGIYIELEPDEEEKAQVEANIQMALSRDQISLDDAIDIRMVKNLKLANELLKLKKKKREEAMAKAQEQQQVMQMQMQMQSQQASAEAKAQQIQLEGQMKMQVKQTEIQLETQKMQMEVEAKKELMQMEFEMNMQLRGMETENMLKREENKEKAKDKRVDIQASRQSELIEQRQKGLPPKNFESNEDSLDGFDLGEFEPR